MRLVLVLGAGISRDVLPLTSSLTEIILAGKTNERPSRLAQRHTDGTYFLDERSLGDVDCVRRVIGYLTWLRHFIASASEQEPDYEALYFACQQVHDVKYGNLDNAILRPFLRIDSRQARRAASGSPFGVLSPMNITREAMRYTAWVVASALWHPLDDATLATRLRHEHRLVLEAAKDKAVTHLDIVTLNHDTLLERSLRLEGIPFEDGFRRPKEGPRLGHRPSKPRVWRGFRFKRRHKIRLIKVHGSVDWWRVRPEGGDWRTQEFVASDLMPLRTTDASGRAWTDPLDQQPLVLIGTFNKILEYASPFPLDRYVVFRRALKRSDHVVVSGYSFRDQAVNGLLIDWFRRTSGRFVAISPGLEAGQAPATAREAISGKWKLLADEGFLVPIPARFSDVSWPEVKGILHGSGRST